MGLIVPHIMRKIMGGEYSKVIPASVFCGAIIMLLADVVGRMLNAPYDTPVGALVSVIGLPFFLGLTYKKGGRKRVNKTSRKVGILVALALILLLSIMIAVNMGYSSVPLKDVIKAFFGIGIPGKSL